MAKSAIRAMSVGEILDTAFAIYRERFGVLMGISIVFLGVPALLGVYVELSGGALEQSGLFLLTLLLRALGALPAAAAIVSVVSEAALGRTPELGASISRGLSRALRLFVAGVAAYILVMLGLLALIIPGIIVACGYSVMVQVVALEDLESGTDALGRSWALTKGYKGKAFKLALTFALMVSVPFMAAAVLAGMVPGLLVPVTVAAQVMAFVLTPLFSCVFTLFYYDLRVRQEGFDLDHLSQQLGLATAARA